MRILEAAVQTILVLVKGDLPEPESGSRLPGAGGWYYSQVPVGGKTPPSGKFHHLWRLEFYGGGPPSAPRLTPEQLKQLLSLPPGLRTLDLRKNAKPGVYYCLYVAPSSGFWHWWVEGSGLQVSVGPMYLQGNLPLVFANRRTPEDSVQVQAGVQLCRQGWKDEGFIKWLLDWVRLRSSEELAGEIVIRLLDRYNPATCSPAAYVKLWARKSLPTPTTVEKLAMELGLTERGLYKALERRGAVRIVGKTHGEVTRLRRVYELMPEVLEAIKQEQEARRKRGALVELVMRRRGVGRRAAERWVKRRLDRGMNIEDVAKELLSLTRGNT